MSVPPSDERQQGKLDDPARGAEIDTDNAAATAAAEPARPAPPSDSSDVGAPAGIDFEDRWRRAVADLDNVRKRQARDLVQERAAERARVAAAFLPVLDTIDMALAHQAQRLLDQLGDSVPAHERSRAELLITDARQAVQEQTPIDRVRELASELQSVLSGLQAIRSGGRSGTEDAGATADEDVIDAEFDRS